MQVIALDVDTTQEDAVAYFLDFDFLSERKLFKVDTNSNSLFNTQTSALLILTIFYISKMVQQAILILIRNLSEIKIDRGAFRVIVDSFNPFSAQCCFKATKAKFRFIDSEHV